MISAISRKCLKVFDAFIILLEHIQSNVVNQFSSGIVSSHHGLFIFVSLGTNNPPLRDASFFQDRQTTTWDVFETGVNTGDIYHISTSAAGFLSTQPYGSRLLWSSTAASDMFFFDNFQLGWWITMELQVRSFCIYIYIYIYTLEVETTKKHRFSRKTSFFK